MLISRVGFTLNLNWFLTFLTCEPLDQFARRAAVVENSIYTTTSKYFACALLKR